MASFIELKNVGTRRHQHFVPRPSYVVVNLHRFLIFGCKGTHISKICKDESIFFWRKIQEPNEMLGNATAGENSYPILSRKTYSATKANV